MFRRSRPPDVRLGPVVTAVERHLEGEHVLLHEREVISVHPYLGGCAVDTTSPDLAEQLYEHFRTAGYRATFDDHRAEKWQTVVVFPKST